MSDQDPNDSKRRRLESVIPDLLKRAVELGVEKATEAPDNLKSFVGDLKLPKEIVQFLFSQIDETKNGLFRVVAKEMRDFLEHTNFAGELQKILTTVQFEVNTTIRFRPNDGGSKDRDPDEAGAPASGTGAPSSASPSAPPPPGEDAKDARRDAVDTRLPKPEVRTQVAIRRGERERRRRRA